MVKSVMLFLGISAQLNFNNIIIEYGSLLIRSYLPNMFKMIQNTLLIKRIQCQTSLMIFENCQ